MTFKGLVCYEILSMGLFFTVNLQPCVSLVSALCSLRSQRHDTTSQVSPQGCIIHTPIFHFFLFFIMFKLFSRSSLTSPISRSNFIKPNLPIFTRTMATGAASNDDLKVNKLFNVSNYSAIVTGGGTGIGLMITQTLVAKAYITGRRKEALDTVVQKYSTGRGKIVALPGDVTKKEEIMRFSQGS